MAQYSATRVGGAGEDFLLLLFLLGCRIVILS